MNQIFKFEYKLQRECMQFCSTKEFNVHDFVFYNLFSFNYYPILFLYHAPPPKKSKQNTKTKTNKKTQKNQTNKQNQVKLHERNIRLSLSTLIYFQFLKNENVLKICRHH